MKIVPLTTEDPWFSHVLRHDKATIQTLEAVPVDITVMMEQAELFAGEAAQQHKPRLALSGQITKVVPRGVALPYNITEMELASDLAPSIDVVYEFSREQLVELVRKGYFETGFQAPEVMVGAEWVLPMETNMVVVEPREYLDPPIVILGLQTSKITMLNEKNSGYELTEYFTELPQQVTVEHGEAPHESGELSFGEHTNELADHELFPEHQEVVTAEVVTTEAEAVTEEDLAAERYRERIKARLDAEGSLSEPSPGDRSQFIPMSEDGYLAFELDESVLVDGSIAFDFDDGEPDDETKWGMDDDTVYELEPHQRASYIPTLAQQEAYAELAIAAERLGEQGIEHTVRESASTKAPRPQPVPDVEPSDSGDLEFG